MFISFKIFSNHRNTLKVLLLWAEILYWSNIKLIECDENIEYKSDGDSEGARATVPGPIRIYECLYNMPVLRCGKLYLLQRMDEGRRRSSGNIAKDFMELFFNSTEPLDSLVKNKYAALTDPEIDGYLKRQLHKYFSNYSMQWKILPNFLIQIQSNLDDSLKVSLKRKYLHHAKKLKQGRGHNSIVDYLDEATSNLFFDRNDDDGQLGAGGLVKSKASQKKNKKTKKGGAMSILRMAVPVMLMPTILMGTFLPFWLPVLKMATLAAMFMNNTAFISALIYAIRSHVNRNQDQHETYYNYASHSN